MWLTDLLPSQPKIRPTRPTSKNDVGRPESFEYVSSSDTSDNVRHKKAESILAGEKHQKEEGITQVSYKNPESVRHLPSEDGAAKNPTPKQVAYARSLLVDCPSQGRKLHCWYCSRCSEARTCTAWEPLRREVMFFRNSGKPDSLYLVEEMEAEGVIQ